MTTQTTSSPDPTALTPRTEVVVVVVEADGTYTISGSDALDPIAPQRALGILRAAAMQIARRHGINGRDALEAALESVVSAVVAAAAVEATDFELAAPSEAGRG